MENIESAAQEPMQSQPVQNPQLQSTGSSKKIIYALISVFIVVLILTIIGSYYLGKQSQIAIDEETTAIIKDQSPSNLPITENPTTQTYTDNVLKLSFEYPTDWVVLESSSSADKYHETDTYHEILMIRLKSDLDASSTSKIIDLAYYDNSEKLSIQDFNQKYLNESVGGDPINIWSPSDEIISNKNGMQAYFAKEHYCVNVCQLYVFSNDNKIFLLKNRLYGGAENQDEVFKQIFNSFKFL